MGIHVESDKVHHAAGKLGCLILNTPFSYLGTKVGGIMTRAEAWKEVIDKSPSSRLSKWKMRALSIGGRLTLLKSVLGSIPIFYMSIYRVPASVLKKLEAIRCNFFNGHEEGSRKASWTKWNNVLADKCNGGLGVSSLFALNRGLMMKWMWRFYSYDTSLWSNVIKAIHGDDGNVNLTRKSGMRSSWSYIVNEAKALEIQGVNVLDNMHLKLGDGTTALFWKDNWSGKGSLKTLYPRLYSLENQKEVSVSSKMTTIQLVHYFHSFLLFPLLPSRVGGYMDLGTLGIFSVRLSNSANHRWAIRLAYSTSKHVGSNMPPIKAKNRARMESKKWMPLPTRFNLSRRVLCSSFRYSCPTFDNASKLRIIFSSNVICLDN
ncbi:hypothetical protein Tco_1192225 [Tanacetum coccineum]